MSYNFGTSTFPLVALLVNVTIVSGTVVRISHLYGVGAETYAYYGWTLGTAIIVLLCINALYAFTGYAIITGRKLSKQLIISTTITQIVLLIAVTAITMDPLMFLGLASSIASTIAVIASMYRVTSTT
ncbi:MAG: hypothetical protein QXD66_00970 [Candidatus Nezhaarchaeales archaeon]|nr:MAG: hypothetical protein DSO06_05940 [Candidatus Nezhaarchaeota archaeon WYZ-LMO8]TDA34532.1 MAG: hypothetical protein DSO05_06525 [Candidatus Nezhaarchaeota archaeon WYZ-LMO7]